MAVAIAILLSGLATPFAASAQSAPIDGAATSHPYAAHVADAARRFGLPESWIWAVMRVESNGDVRAVSTVGAMGLMQIMPATWAALRARYRLGSDPFDPRDNVMAGAAYLREMHDRYGNVTAMLAAFNAGPGRYDDHLSRGRPLPAETRGYIAKLASITGAAGDTQLAATPAPDSFAWRRAELFAVRSRTLSTRQFNADRPASDAPLGPAADERTGIAVAGVLPPTNSLFAPLSGRSPR